MTVDPVEELRAFRAANDEALEQVVAEAPPPPAEGLAMAAATGCPTVRPARLKAAS